MTMHAAKLMAAGFRVGMAGLLLLAAACSTPVAAPPVTSPAVSAPGDGKKPDEYSYPDDRFELCDLGRVHLRQTVAYRVQRYGQRRHRLPARTMVLAALADMLDQTM
jgi:hypothetical protein